MSRGKVIVFCLVVGIAGALGWFMSGGDRPTRDRPEKPTSEAATTTPNYDLIDASTPDATVASVPDPQRSQLRGASVRGAVIDPHGAPLAEHAVTLVDARGEVVDTIVTAADGSYEVVDERLSARAIVVSDGESRPLDPPLVDGELRALDLVVGQTRVVRGFVLDMQGEPLAGVSIKLVGMDFDRRWSTVSDNGGGFFFTHAATAPLRVEATGLGGEDAAWVAAGEAEVLVELVLEPSARITVTGPPEATSHAHVRIRCVGDGCFGTDRAWQGANDATLMAESVEKMRRYTLDFAMTFYPELVPADADGLDVETLTAAIGDAMQRLTPEAAEALGRRMDKDAIERYTAEHLPNALATPPERWSTVAEGALGETFVVSADLSYAIDIIDLGPSTSGECGTVRPAPGDDLTVPCGVARDAVLMGRVVDQDGHGRGGMAIVTPRVEQPTYSAADGRFRLTIRTDRMLQVDLDVATPSFYGGRRNLRLLPGETRDIGDLLVRREADRPERWPSAPHGGVGGLMALTEGGLRIDAVEALGPLALAGVEDGDTIVHIEDLSAAEMTIDEALTRLRGEPGTSVGVRVRSRYGELYDVLIERGLVPPPNDLMIERFGEGPYPPGY